MLRTANPALSKKTFATFEQVAEAEKRMTIQGTVNKTFLSLFILIGGAMYTWKMYFSTVDAYGIGDFAVVQPWMIVGFIGGFIVALVTVFNRKWSYITTPIYAVLEGLALGGLSAFVESMYPGIVLQAVALTFGTLFSLLFAYKSGLIKATENFKMGVAAATGGIFLIYMMTWILSFFGTGIPYIHENGLIGIGFSVFVVIIAALNLVLDFDFIECGAEHGAPKYMEWYAAFGLMVTLVWLYIEILRLLMKLRSR
ncbi:MAG: Bax inhibitor-1/YccA family protein [Bacteroidota bacterium]